MDITIIEAIRKNGDLIIEIRKTLNPEGVRVINTIDLRFQSDF
jgi:hypothetical protein